MADLFVSYASADREPVCAIASRLEQTGHQVWWDVRLRAHQDYGKEITAALQQARCAIVAWSTTARDSIWVRAEATAALESDKLVQLSLDGAKPPLPFTMIQLLDFSKAREQTDDLSWRHLVESVDAVLGGRASAVPAQAAGVRLAGFGPLVAVGGASLALVLLAAGCVVLAATKSFSANLFGLISGAMLLAAMLAFAYMLIRFIKIYLASR